MADSAQNPLPSLEPQRVAVLGAGAWGIVLAAHLSRQGHSVLSWDISPDVVQKLSETRRHPKLPGFTLPQGIALTSELEDVWKGMEDGQGETGWDAVLVVTPSHGLPPLARKWRERAASPWREKCPWILCSKGLEEESLLPLTEVLVREWGEEACSRTVVLSGPSFAAEVALEKPTTVSVASESPDQAAYVQALCMSPAFRVYTQDDPLGVELGGALKNVVAIAAGVCDGMQLGDNARAALITRGLAEMIRLGVALGARPETFAGLTGMGDLILTCCGPLSRNRSFGMLLAQGKSVDAALEEIGMVVEGMGTARTARQLAERHGVEMPIVREVCRLIYEGKSPRDALRDLMQREARPEAD